jgi:hypothetical protein
LTEVRPQLTSSRSEKVAITLPQLGVFECDAATDHAFILPKIALPFRVYRVPDGRFFRAEFIAPGSPDHASSLEEIELALRSSNEAYIGLPNEHPKVGWKAIVAKLRELGNIAEAKRITITLVNYRRGSGPPKPMYLVNVFGAMKIDDLSGDQDVHKRVRIIYSASGRLILEDNLL